jgi:sterol 3beta-glucosyltransferase
MKIAILTTGSRGDMQPLAALGRKLVDEGHMVSLATVARYEPFVGSLGMRFSPVRGDVSELMRSGELSDAVNADNPVKALRALRDPRFTRLLDQATEDLLDACEGSDLILHHPGATIGSFYARAAGVPAYIASPFPLTPTSEYPSLLFARYPLPRVANRLTHSLFLRGFWGATSSSTIRVARNRGLISSSRVANPLLESRPVLVSTSEHVFPVEEPSRATGFWFVDDEPYDPPADLASFLDAGDPPAYAGFGSVGNPGEAREMGTMLLEAARLAGRRLLIAGGYGGLDLDSAAGDDVFIIESAPHSWLFPRMGAVIHHGGAGTTAAGLQAGVPSLIIPHGNDQFAWARAVREKGVGPGLPPRRKLTAGAIADALRQAAQPDMRRRASDLAGKIRTEGGAAAMARQLPDLARSA